MFDHKNTVFEEYINIENLACSSIYFNPHILFEHIHHYHYCCYCYCCLSKRLKDSEKHISSRSLLYMNFFLVSSETSCQGRKIFLFLPLQLYTLQIFHCRHKAHILTNTWKFVSYEETLELYLPKDSEPHYNKTRHHLFPDFYLLLGLCHV